MKFVVQFDESIVKQKEVFVEESILSELDVLRYAQNRVHQL